MAGGRIRRARLCCHRRHAPARIGRGYGRSRTGLAAASSSMRESAVSSVESCPRTRTARIRANRELCGVSVDPVRRVAVHYRFLSILRPTSSR